MKSLARCVFIGAAAGLLHRPAAAVPTVAEIQADPVAAYQGIWETRFCHRSHQWRVEGRQVLMHKKDTSPNASSYDNRIAVGSPVMILEDARRTMDRGIALSSTWFDETGYGSKGNWAALTLYKDQYGPYVGFNEMIRLDVKARQCGGPAPATAETNKAQAKAKAVRSTVETSPPTPKGPTPNQLKYQRELAEYNARLAEIEKIKTDIASKHATDTAAAAQVLAQHEGDLARHRAQVAQANALQRQYEQDLAAHQARVSSTETKQDRETKVDWKEAVVVCSLNPSDGQSKFGNWRCEGPLQMTYAKLGGAGEAASQQAVGALSQACGGSREAIRDLGMVGSDWLFGCSFGIHPKSINASSKDMAARHGISYIPGRAIYRCPAYKSACRTQ